MATKKRRKRGGRRGKGGNGGGGALMGLRTGFKSAAGQGRRRRSRDKSLVWIFWGLLGIALLLFALSFVRP